MASKMKLSALLVAVLLLVAMPQATTAQSKSDEQPEVQRVIGPSYPPVANLVGVEGTVKVIATVLPAGTVDSVRVISGSPYLSESAKQALLGWHFRCPNVNKPCEATVSFIFKLGEICSRQSCPSEFQVDLPDRVTVRQKRNPGNRD